ncbi:MAG TPA: hypothetical protein VFC58_06285 [Desulfosporosinus sp.]|nr:hypothetical protein [Desulfosporosinus sp.]
MEAYFHSDPRIEEWVDQITEKLFAVCLLTGADSEAEFQRGCEIVAKVTHLLQGISIFPSEYLEDGLKQILEQQLPDSRVINNFPTFQNTMSRMLRQGMMQAIDTQNIENLQFIASTEITTNEITEDIIEDQTVQRAEESGRSVNILDDEILTERAMTALASIKSTTSVTTTNLLDRGVGLQAIGLAELMVTNNDEPLMVTASTVPSILTKPYGIIRKTEVPEQAVRLKQVLNKMFPKVSICWNLNLMGHIFLAQVEDILIYLYNAEQTCQVETLNIEGWKVYVCNSNDLMFPRRLERGIRQIQRLGKSGKKG